MTGRQNSILLRLEISAVLCFVGVTADSNFGKLRLKIWKSGRAAVPRETERSWSGEFARGTSMASEKFIAHHLKKTRERMQPEVGVVIFRSFCKLGRHHGGQSRAGAKRRADRPRHAAVFDSTDDSDRSKVSVLTRRE